MAEKERPFVGDLLDAKSPLEMMLEVANGEVENHVTGWLAMIACELQIANRIAAISLILEYGSAAADYVTPKRTLDDDLKLFEQLQKIAER